MPLSDFDRAHMRDILDGMGDWYSARLMRALHSLIPHSDAKNLARLRKAFPDEVAAYEDYYRGGSSHE